MIDEPEIFFDSTGGFAADFIRADGTKFAGIIDRPYAESEGMSGESISMMASKAALASTVNGDILRIDQEPFRVVSIARGVQDTVVRLAKPKIWQSTLYSDDGVFSALWVDESHATYPVGLPYPPEAGEDTLLLRKTPTRAHVLFTIPPLAPDFVPVNAVVISAELRVIQQRGLWDETLTTDARQVLRSMVSGQTSWNNYRTGRAWTGKGCTGSGTDHGAVSMGIGPANQSGDDMTLAYGDSFAALITAYLASTLGLVILAGGSGEARMRASFMSLVLSYCLRGA